MRANRKLLIPCLFLVPLLVAGCAEEQVVPERPRLVLAMKLGDPSTFEDRWVPGRAKATRELDLSFRVGGRMIARPVNVGDELKAGDLVAQIDRTDYEVDVQNAEGNRDAVKAKQKSAQSEARPPSNGPGRRAIGRGPTSRPWRRRSPMLKTACSVPP
jgi:multidrug efflux pump subunit AcrA (membrane-fusion protein)